MVFISVTRLRLSSILHLPVFFIKNEKVIKQLKHSDGFISGKLLVDKHLTFWTLTLWESETHMKAFRNSFNHKKAMPRLPGWCDEASYTHWLSEKTELPDWNEIHAKLSQYAKYTKVKKPSQAHSNKIIPPIQWKKMERLLIKSKG